MYLATMLQFIKKINWDLMGIITSVACAIHCALLPLLLTSLPLFGINIIDNIYFEWLMITIAFCVGCFALLHGYSHHHKRFKPILIFSIGFVFLILKQFFYAHEFYFLAPAVFFILYAHFLNFRFCNFKKTNSAHNMQHT